MSVDEFFRTARERHHIYIKRHSGESWPWTEDPVFREWRFCNVFRERDTTTEWFREHVRNPLRTRPEVLLATVVFRLFNRITTGEAIFSQMAVGLGDELPGETAWDAYLRTGDTGILRAAVLQYCGDGPYVTGSYIIKTPDGMDKVDGVLSIISSFRNSDWMIFAEAVIIRPCSLQLIHQWLMRHDFIGHFTAYEIVSDLRWTILGHRAPDIMTWANLGPGAKRGLGRLPELEGSDMLKLRDLLELSRSPKFWPPNWPQWEMREVEHWLCEYDKYQRILEGGQLRQRFHHP